MYNTNSYKVRYPRHEEIERYYGNIESRINSIESIYKEKIIKLDEEKEIASHQADFHLESYIQHDYEPARINVGIAENDELASLLKDVFSKFETSLKDIAIHISSTDEVETSIKTSKEKKSKIEKYQNYIIKKQKINDSSLQSLWGKINSLKIVRNEYEHDGNKSTRSSEELKKTIVDLKNNMWESLDLLLRLLHSNNFHS